MGFKKVYVAKDSFARGVKFENIEVVALKTLNEVIHDVYK